MATTPRGYVYIDDLASPNNPALMDQTLAESIDTDVQEVADLVETIAEQRRLAYGQGPATTTNYGTSVTTAASCTFTATAGHAYEIYAAVSANVTAATTARIQMGGTVAGVPTDYLWWRASTAAQDLDGVSGVFPFTATASGSVTVRIDVDAQGGTNPLRIVANKARIWVKDVTP